MFDLFAFFVSQKTCKAHMIIWCLCCFCFFNAIFLSFASRVSLSMWKKTFSKVPHWLLLKALLYMSKLPFICAFLCTRPIAQVEIQLSLVKKQILLTRDIFIFKKTLMCGLSLIPNEITLQKWHRYDLKYTSKCNLSLSIVPKSQ